MITRILIVSCQLTILFDNEKKASGSFLFIHYYQIVVKQKNSYLVIRENTNGDKSLYTITDKIKNKEKGYTDL